MEAEGVHGERFPGKVALKSSHCSGDLDDRIVAREEKAFKALRHRNIVLLLGTYKEYEGEPASRVLELCDKNLRRFIQEANHPLSKAPAAGHNQGHP